MGNGHDAWLQMLAYHKEGAGPPLSEAGDGQDKPWAGWYALCCVLMLHVMALASGLLVSNLQMSLLLCMCASAAGAQIECSQACTSSIMCRRQALHNCCAYQMRLVSWHMSDVHATTCHTPVRVLPSTPELTYHASHPPLTL